MVVLGEWVLLMSEVPLYGTDCRVQEGLHSCRSGFLGGAIRPTVVTSVGITTLKLHVGRHPEATRMQYVPPPANALQ